MSDFLEEALQHLHLCEQELERHKTLYIRDGAYMEKTSAGLLKEIESLKGQITAMLTQIIEAANALKPPFLTLPEEMSTEQAAYRRGAYDAYSKVIEALKEIK